MKWRRLLFVLVTCSAVAGCSSFGPHADMDPAKEYDLRYPYALVSPGAQFGELPPAVRRTVLAETGSAQLSGVVRDTSSGRLTYIIFFQEHDLYPPLHVAPDGSVLRPDGTVAVAAPRDTKYVLSAGPVSDLTLGDVPPKVAQVVQQRAPDAEIDHITKEGIGDQVHYIIRFKGDRRPPITIGQDSTILPEGESNPTPITPSAYRK